MPRFGSLSIGNNTTLTEFHKMPTFAVVSAAVYESTGSTDSRVRQVWRSCPEDHMLSP